jgi:hypothetical protein
MHMTGKGKMWVALSLVLCAGAAVGISPLSQGGCGPVQVVDSKTGLLRPATPDEVYSAVAPAEAAVGTALVAAGQPQWWLLMDAGVRIGALLTALYSGWKIPAPAGNPVPASPSPGAVQAGAGPQGNGVRPAGSPGAAAAAPAPGDPPAVM